MAEVILGRTGIRTDKTAFGALPIQRVDTDYAVMLLKKAYDAGISLFDTARAYTDSEEKVGIALSGVRDKITLTTKTGAKTPEDLRRDLETSLRNLKTDYIDVYQLHNPDFCPKPGDGSGLYEAMLKARDEGKIRFIGITNHKLHIAEEAVESGLYDTLQFPLCYLAAERDIALYERCVAKNVGFIAMKALSGGLLTNAAAAFAWLCQFPQALPVWGVQRESELDEFIRYMNAPPSMTDEIRAVIENDRQELSGSFCRGCGYCMPCPMEIRISDCARVSQLIRRGPTTQWFSEEGQAMMKKVDDCIGCGQCSEKCPYEHDVPQLLKRNYEDYKVVLAASKA